MNSHPVLRKGKQPVLQQYTMCTGGREGIRFRSTLGSGCSGDLSVDSEVRSSKQGMMSVARLYQTGPSAGCAKPGRCKAVAQNRTLAIGEHFLKIQVQDPSQDN